VRLVVNATTGEVAQSIDYDAYGRVINETGTGFQPFGFAGGLYDATTKLVRFGARDYDANTGRWTNKDPIGFAGQQGNVYLYVNGDPVNGRDLRGLEESKSCGWQYVGYGAALLSCAGGILSFGAVPFTLGLSTAGSVMATSAACTGSVVVLREVAKCREEQANAETTNKAISFVESTCNEGTVVLNAHGVPECVKRSK
jgi:RHS repeat-associated protein